MLIFSCQVGMWFHTGFQKTAIPWSTTPQRSCPPVPQFNVVFWILCLAAFQKNNHFCWWCSALPITTLHLGVSRVSKVSLWFHVDGCYFEEPGMSHTHIIIYIYIHTAYAHCKWYSIYVYMYTHVLHRLPPCHEWRKHISPLLYTTKNM